MHSESKLAPVLGHLAWLADRVASEDNAGRAYDASLLTYNAAAMLQWRFVAPVSYADTIMDRGSRMEAARLIDGLVSVSQRLIGQAGSPSKADDRAIRMRLAKEIGKVLRELPLLLHSTPRVAPMQMPELEQAASIRGLIDEFMAEHGDSEDAIARGRAKDRKQGAGPEAALCEAIASLIYAHEPARDTAEPRIFANLAAGFFKAAVFAQSEEMLPQQMQRWRQLAERVVADVGLGEDKK